MHKEVGVSRNHDPLRASIGQALKLMMMMMTVVMMMILHDGRDGDDGVDNNYDDDDAGRLSLSIVRVPTCHCL